MLLNLIYKILSKILACRFKPMMELLVDSKQRCFISGKNIIDNILAFRLGKELTIKKKLHAIFIMWNFMKAYDCLDHTFICDTLLALGFNKKNSPYWKVWCAQGHQRCMSMACFHRSLDWTKECDKDVLSHHSCMHYINATIDFDVGGGREKRECQRYPLWRRWWQKNSFRTLCRWHRVILVI